MPIQEYRQDQKWPPEEWNEVYNLYTLHDAWYSGDPNKLAAIYQSLVATPTPRGAHWAREVKEERRTMLHVPIAGDLAGTSADLIFGEAPKFRIAEAHDENALAGAKKTQDRLDEIINLDNVANKLHEAAESCAALGGVFIKPNWDQELADHPILSIAQADNAIPEFKWGMLTAVTFWKVLEEDDFHVWRLLERHEKGFIFYGLYKGKERELGMQVGLTVRSDTADLPEVLTTEIDELLVRYIPNMRPHRMMRGLQLGRSDYSGNEGLMDALDEVFTSWMRDIRLGQGRIMVPEAYLERKVDGGHKFDVDAEIFVPFDMDPLSAENIGIKANQFEIRTEDHKNTALELIDRIVTNSGYSPQTFGLNIEGRAESGTALNIRERRTFLTKGKKENYWKTPVEDILQMMLLIDKQHLGGKVEIFRPNVEFQDSMYTDVSQLAESVETLNRAQAVSIETKVRMLHPDWEKEQIEAEIEAIKADTGMNMETEIDDLPV